ncbi:MAG: hypothetical protein HQL15_04235, partial [Candidatus Omnitrophica bacterium]|nr:hypothetical protein [Candidatus Omnitrophota bacterium]
MVEHTLQITKLYGLVILIVMVFVVDPSFALEPDQETVMIVSAIEKPLKLTSAQEKGVIVVFRDYFSQVGALRAEVGNESNLQQKIKYLREDLDSNLSHYLSEEQMAAWKIQMDRMAKESSPNTQTARPVEPQTQNNDDVLQSGSPKI